MKRDIENAVEGRKTCLSGRHCSAVLLISKFRAQHALIRGDFEPLHELEPVKILPLLFLFLCSPSYPGQTLAGCDFKYACWRLLSCILTESLCVKRHAYMQQHNSIRKYLRKHQTFRQVYVAQCSYSQSKFQKLWSHISLMLSFHLAVELFHAINCFWDQL